MKLMVVNPNISGISQFHKKYTGIAAINDVTITIIIVTIIAIIKAIAFLINLFIFISSFKMFNMIDINMRLEDLVIYMHDRRQNYYRGDRGIRTLAD